MHPILLVSILSTCLLALIHDRFHGILARQTHRIWRIFLNFSFINIIDDQYQFAQFIFFDKSCIGIINFQTFEVEST